MDSTYLFLESEPNQWFGVQPRPLGNMTFGSGGMSPRFGDRLRLGWSDDSTVVVLFTESYAVMAYDFSADAFHSGESRVFTGGSDGHRPDPRRDDFTRFVRDLLAAHGGAAGE